MTDWRSCSVVWDRDDDLWGRERGGWFLITSEDTESWAPSDDFLVDHFGPITPALLDADSLPVVRTVGDLTARHIGRRVRVDATPDAYRIVEGMLTHLCALEDEIVLTIADDESVATLECTLATPCEVLDA